jgi:hypothetical protein
MASILHSVLHDTKGVLENWTSKNIVKRVWGHRELAGIADGVDRRLDAFRDVFSVGPCTLCNMSELINMKIARLTELARNLDTLAANV